MPNLVKYESNIRLVGGFYKTSDTMYGVYRSIGTDPTNVSHFVYPYGSWINWFGTDWLIGGAGSENATVPGISYVYTCDVNSAINHAVGIDTTYFTNSLIQLSVINSKSLYYYSFPSTVDTNLKLYISGLCKANSATSLSLSYAYSTDGTDNFSNIVTHSGSASLTTDWTPFVYKTTLNFGSVSEVRLIPVVWTGTYLYGPTIKDLTIMLVSDSLV